MSRARELSELATAYDSGGGFGFRNRIINGDMRIDQRNAGASVTPGAAGFVYTLDRWNFYVSQASKLTTQQNAGSVTPPAGFKNYLGVTSSSAYSVTSSDVFTFQQVLEGFNVADFGWGAAGAQSVTLSFWVRSSLTGTFGGALQNTNSGANRSYPFTFSISAANTWEQKTVTVAGDTSGTWGSTNGEGLTLKFGLGVGSTFSGTAGVWAGSNLWSATGAVSVVGTSGATFYITGVQLEAGSVASPFERRDYGRELMMCQRYYYKQQSTTNYTNFGMGRSYSTTGAQAAMSLPVSMRASPTGSYSALSDFNSAAGTITAMSPAGNIGSDFRWVMIDITQTGGATAQTIALNANNNNNAWMAWSAEL